MSTYADKNNPYTQWHMQRAFRLGWEAADDGLDERQAERRAENSKLNKMTMSAWWRGFLTQRGEYGWGGRHGSTGSVSAQ